MTDAGERVMTALQRILALDQATTSGVAWSHDLGVSTRWSTTMFLDPKKFPARGAKLAAFRLWLLGKIRSEEPDVIAYERPHLRGFAPTMMGAGLAGVVEMCASERGVPYLMVPSRDIKKHAGLPQHAKKPEMVRLARARGWEVRSDDEADALWLLDYVCSEIAGGRLVTGKGKR